MQIFWACDCGYEKECRAEDISLGAVFQCESCKTVWACVYPRRGGKAWIHVSNDDLKFHRLLDEAETE